MILLNIFKAQRKEWIFPILFSFIIVTIFSFSTSWLFDKPLMYDSAVFQLIGKNWSEGRIPYVDLWEMKGPLVFLPSALGYWFMGSKFGVYVIQLFNLTITFFIIQKTFLLEFNRKHSILLTGLSAIYFAVLYESGNTVEEYILPLLSFAFYLLYRYVTNCIEIKEYDLPSEYAFVYGCVLGFSLMSRLTNAISICVAVSVIGIMLIARKRWNNLILSFLWFICGFCVITIPFVVYFYSKDALEEMWYGTFLFGLEYTGNSGFELFSLFGLRHIILRLANCYFLVFSSLMMLKFNPQRKIAGWMWLIISVCTFIMFLRLKPFGHYYIIALPFIPIILIEIHKMWVINKNRWIRNYFLFVMAAFLVLGIIGVVNNANNYLTIFHDYNNKELAVYRRIVEKLPVGYRSSFIAYDCDTEMYLYLDIPPQYPYYTLQSGSINLGPSIKSRIEDCFRDGGAKWLVVYGQPSILLNILNEKYNYMFSEKSTRGGMYYVYSKK